jgi:hypothetical protein
MGYAVVLAGATWAMLVVPLGVEDSRVATAVVYVFVFPVAVAGAWLPSEARGIDLFFWPGAIHGMPAADILLRHLRIAIPVYVLLFYLPNLFRGLYRWIKARDGARQPESSTRSESGRVPTR